MSVRKAMHDAYNAVDQFGGLNTYQLYIAISEFGKVVRDSMTQMAASFAEEEMAISNTNTMSDSIGNMFSNTAYDLVSGLASTAVSLEDGAIGEAYPSPLVVHQDTYWSRILVGGMSQVGDLRVPQATADTAAMVFSQIEGCLGDSVAHLDLSGKIGNWKDNNSTEKGVIIEMVIENVNNVCILLEAFFGQRDKNNKSDNTLQQCPKSQTRTLYQLLDDDDNNEEADLPVNLLSELLHDYSEGVLLSCFALTASAAHSVHAIQRLGEETIQAINDTNTGTIPSSSINNGDDQIRKEALLKSLTHLIDSARYSSEQLYLSNIVSQVLGLVIKRADAITFSRSSLASQQCGRVVGNLRNAQRENLRHQSGGSTDEEDTCPFPNETSKRSTKTKGMMGGFKLCPVPSEESLEDDFLINGVTLIQPPQGGSTTLNSSDALVGGTTSSCTSRSSSASAYSKAYRRHKKWALVPSYGEAGAQIVALGLQIIAWHYEVYGAENDSDNSACVSNGSYADPGAAAECNVTRGLRGAPMSLPQKRLNQLRSCLTALLKHCAGIQIAATKSQLSPAVTTDIRNDNSTCSALSYTAKLAVPVSRLLHHIVVATIKKKRQGKTAINTTGIFSEPNNKEYQKNNHHYSKENPLNCGIVNNNDDKHPTDVVSVDVAMDKIALDKNSGEIDIFYQWARVSLAEETILPAINRYCMLLLMIVRSNHQQLYREGTIYNISTTAENSSGETPCEKIVRGSRYHILLLVHTIESLAKLAAEVLSYSPTSATPFGDDGANMEWLKRVFNIAPSVSINPDNTNDSTHPQDSSESSGNATPGRRNDTTVRRSIPSNAPYDSLHFLPSVLGLRNSIMSSVGGGGRAHIHHVTTLSKPIGDTSPRETTISYADDTNVPLSYTTGGDQLDTPLFIAASILWALVVVPAIRACPSLPQCAPLATGLEEHFGDAFEVATDRLMLTSAVNAFHLSTLSQPNARSLDGNRQLEYGAISLRNSLMEAVSAAIECSTSGVLGRAYRKDSSEASHLMSLLLSHSLDSFSAIVKRETQTIYTANCIKEQKDENAQTGPSSVAMVSPITRPTIGKYLYSCQYLMKNGVEWLKGWFQFISSIVQPSALASDIKPHLLNQLLPIITRASRVSSTNIVSTLVNIMQFCEESFEGEDGASESATMITDIQRTLAEGTLELMVVWTNTTSVMYLSNGIDAALSGDLGSDSMAPGHSGTPSMTCGSSIVSGDNSNNTRGGYSRGCGQSKISAGGFKRRHATADDIQCSDKVEVGFGNLRISSKRKSFLQNHLWPCIDDSDDLHDYLVAVIPIMNAILQMSPHFIILNDEHLEADSQYNFANINPPKDPLTRYWDTVLQSVLLALGTSNDLPMQVMCLYTIYNAIHAIQNKSLVEIPTINSLNKQMHQLLPLDAIQPSCPNMFHTKSDNNLSTRQECRPVRTNSSNGGFTSNPSWSKRWRMMSTRQYDEPSHLSLANVCAVVVSNLVQVRVGQVTGVLRGVGWTRKSSSTIFKNLLSDEDGNQHTSLSHRRFKVSPKTFMFTATSILPHSTPGSPSMVSIECNTVSRHCNSQIKANQSLFWYILSEMLSSAGKFHTSDNPDEQGYSTELHQAIRMLVEKILSSLPSLGDGSITSLPSHVPTELLKYTDVMHPEDRMNPSEVPSNSWGFCDIFLINLIKHSGRCIASHQKLLSHISASSVPVAPGQRNSIRNTPEVDDVIKLLMTWLQSEGVRKWLHGLSGGPMAEALTTALYVMDLNENTALDNRLHITTATSRETSSEREDDGRFTDSGTNISGGVFRNIKRGLLSRLMTRIHVTSLTLADCEHHNVNILRPPTTANHSSGRPIAACAPINPGTLKVQSYSINQQAWWYVACQAQKYAHEDPGSLGLWSGEGKRTH